MLTFLCFIFIFINTTFVNPNSLDIKGSCWILKDCYCSVTMLMELGHNVWKSSH